MAKLNKGEVMQAAGLIKALTHLVDKADDEGVTRAYRALHENMKRWAEKNDHGDIIVYGGDT